MRKTLGLIGAVVGLAAVIAVMCVWPTPGLTTEQITLPVTRMLACPVGDPQVGKTVVRVADTEPFTASVVGELPSDPQTSATFENPAKPVIVRGGATVGAVSVYSEGATQLVAPCTSPITWGMWNGVVTQSETATVLLTNVDSAPAVVDVFLYGPNGAIPVPGISDINLAPGTTRMLAVDQLVTVDTPISVQVRASKGRVAALLRSLGSVGYDWQLPQTAPDTDLTINGIPAGDGARTLSVTNTDPTNKAEVSLQILGEAGAFAPLGLEKVEIPPARSLTIDVTSALGSQASAIHLTSTTAISAGVMVASGGEFSAIPAQRAVGGSVVFPAIGGSLWLANPDQAQASVTLRFDDGAGSRTSSTVTVAPQGFTRVDFPATGVAVELTTASQAVRASVGLSDVGLSIVPLWGGGAQTTVDVPRLAPGLGN
ncbi:MAG: DUF5719 family protein [Propionibacteriaceae bacterium]|jgi:hypothetical protein|nr:DUF5719 family protein [Propionibacteriaceae bacterium]